MGDIGNSGNAAIWKSEWRIVTGKEETENDFVGMRNIWNTTSVLQEISHFLNEFEFSDKCNAAYVVIIASWYTHRLYSLSKRLIVVSARAIAADHDRRTRECKIEVDAG